MKRSRSLSLLMMGAATIALSASLSACGDDATSDAAVAEAKAKHAASAPRFSSRAECEKKYGDGRNGDGDGCEVVSENGYTASGHASSGGYYYRPYLNNWLWDDGHATPVYHSRGTDMAHTSDGRWVSPHMTSSRTAGFAASSGSGSSSHSSSFGSVSRGGFAGGHSSGGHGGGGG